MHITYLFTVYFFSSSLLESYTVCTENVLLLKLDMDIVQYVKYIQYLTLIGGHKIRIRQFE